MLRHSWCWAVAASHSTQSCDPKRKQPVLEGREMAQVVKCLLSKNENLRSDWHTCEKLSTSVISVLGRQRQENSPGLLAS